MRDTSFVQRFWSALLAFAAFIALWQLVVVVFKMHPITLPPPGRVLRSIWDERQTLWEGFLATGAASVPQGLSEVLIFISHFLHVVGIGFSAVWTLAATNR